MANSKIITYDLSAPGRNYDDLYKAIKGYPNWAHICESVWVVITTDSCVSIRDNLLKYIDSNDIIFVAKLSTEAAWSNVLCKSQWIKDNL